MSILGLAVLLILIIAACAIVQWYSSKFGPIPQPVLIVIYAIAAIMALVLLFHFLGFVGGPAVVVV